MTHIITMKTTHKTPYDAIDSTRIGKQIIRDVKGKILKVFTITGTKTKTDQAFKDDTDLTHILQPAIRKGLLDHAIKFEGQYDDMPNFDFQEANIKIAKANSMFERLPAKIRTKFNNNPGEFLEFTGNPENKEALQKMGLLKGNDGKTSTGAPSGAPTKTVELTLT